VSERAAAGEHDPRIEVMQHVVGETKFGEGSRFEVHEDRVGLGDQAAEDLLALRAAQIQAQAEVIAVCPAKDSLIASSMRACRSPSG